MASPIIKLKRSAVAGKRPTLANLPLGEIALNTYDGKLFVRQDTSGVGIATTVRTVNPWSENFVSGGEHSIYYDGGNVGIGTDNPTAKLDIVGGVNASGIITATESNIAFFTTKNYSRSWPYADWSNSQQGVTLQSTGRNIIIQAGGAQTTRSYVSLTNGGGVWIGGGTGDPEGVNIEAGSGDVKITGGNVGINSTAPTEKLDVAGTIKTEQLNVTGLSTFVGDANFDNATLYVDSTNNRIGVGLNNPAVPLHMFGSYPTLKIQNTNTTQFASASIDLQGPAGDERYTKILHGNSNTGGTETYFQIEQYDSSGSYVKKIAQYSYQYDYWDFLPAGTRRLRVDTSGIDVTGHTETDTLNVSGLSTFVSNVSFASSALFGDADKILLGDDDDLQIFHDGNSWIRNTNAASNFFVTSALGLQLRVNSSEIALNAVANGATELFYNNAEKLETTSSGINVTGHTETDTLNVSGVSTLTNNVHIPNGDIGIGTDDTSLGKAVFYGTGSGNGQGPILSLVRDSTTPASNDRIGTLQFYGKDSSDNTVKYKSVYARIVDPTAGSVTGQLCIGTDTSTSGRQVVIDADGSVGIGTDDITEKLHVVGNVRSTGVITATSFYGDGSNLTGITADAAVGVQTSGGYVGSGVTAFSFEGNAVGNVTVPSSGISTININATTALSRTVTNVTPTQDQTDFTVSYQVGFIDVYLNGVLLSGSDFTATNGTSVSISTSLSTTDNVDFIAYEGVSAGVVDGVNRWTSVGSSIYNNNSGNVGIGTEKPNSKLQVFGGIVAGDATSGTNSSGFSIFRPYDSTPRTIAIVEDDTKLRIGGGAWDSIIFRTAPLNKARVAITSTGNVGLGGTEEPTQILQIAGNNSSRTIQYGDNSTGYFISRTDVNRGGADQALHIHDFRWNGTSVARIKGLTGDDTINKDNGVLTFETTNGAGLAERVRITSTGDVGIGVTNPDELLEVAGNIKLGASSGTAEFYTDLPELRIGVDKNNNNSDSDITFYTNNSEKVRINNDGDVGIGTSVPSRKLHIYDASGDAQVRIESVASGTDAKLDLLANSTGVSQIRFGDEASVNVGFIVYTHSDDTLAFRTNGVNNRMLLDSSGNLGIGSASPGSRLHVFSAEPEVILVERSSNANAAIQYTNTDGSMYAGLTSNAESWAVDDDNNLGTAPMFCVLRSNGNVGINSSIPGEALDVNGNVKAVDFNSTSGHQVKR